MRSGDFTILRDDGYYRKAFAEIGRREFKQVTFATRPALVAKEPVHGHRMWQDYHGQAYDASKFDLTQGMWDHERCSVCWFSIQDGHTYWENEGRIQLLCDACYEAFSKV